ncbi:hypothetical protein SAMN06265367_104142 [Algoriphagus winogradskyi]|uniref:Uncharacterized protein n=1 Tax=Algoriphagus winogradskyi TaxID=237017 RepID=A0ABY1P6C1_9BACT|nr:hypothetical protein SAMN06265367_104142 [Algoriphagus winogradskyi]
MGKVLDVLLISLIINRIGSIHMNTKAAFGNE